MARLLRYIGRPPISQERVTYDRERGVVTVLSAKTVDGRRPVAARYGPAPVAPRPPRPGLWLDHNPTPRPPTRSRSHPEDEPQTHPPADLDLMQTAQPA